MAVSIPPLKRTGLLAALLQKCRKILDLLQPYRYNPDSRGESMAIVETIRLGPKCQMALPLRMRKAMGVTEGDELLVLSLGNAAVLVPKPRSYADHLLSLHREVWADINPESYLEEERNSWER